MVLVLLAGLGACTTVPTEISPWNIDSFSTADPELPVTVVVLDPAPGPARAYITVTSAFRSDLPSDSALSLGTTPWRRSIGGRRPVGVVVVSGEMRVLPAPPYWAVVLRENGQWQMVPQSELSRELAVKRGTTPELRSTPERPVVSPRAETRSSGLVLAAGGFYPLIIDGEAVAGAFPGTTIRAPRAAIGGTTGGTAQLVVITTGTGDGGGLTTEELAQILLSYDLDWALNLDGGRSAYLRVPDRRILPPGIWFRRRGPVLLRFLPPEGRLPRQEVVQ